MHSLSQGWPTGPCGEALRSARPTTGLDTTSARYPSEAAVPYNGAQKKPRKHK